MLHDLLYHYEVIAGNPGHEQVIARVHTYGLAEEIGARLLQGAPQAPIQIIRRRGLHPFRILNLTMLALLLGVLLPWFWPSLIIVLLSCAVQFGVMSTGRGWIRGQSDDR